jgi:hypothetical protein
MPAGTHGVSHRFEGHLVLHLPVTGIKLHIRVPRITARDGWIELTVSRVLVHEAVWVDL